MALGQGKHNLSLNIIRNPRYSQFFKSKLLRNKLCKLSPMLVIFTKLLTIILRSIVTITTKRQPIKAFIAFSMWHSNPDYDRKKFVRCLANANIEAQEHFFPNLSAKYF
jgi:hypothetical protein